MDNQRSDAPEKLWRNRIKDTLETGGQFVEMVHGLRYERRGSGGFLNGLSGRGCCWHQGWRAIVFYFSIIVARCNNLDADCDMPRITTSDAPQRTVEELAKVAKENHRTSAAEALVAVQSHLLLRKLRAENLTKPKRK